MCALWRPPSQRHSHALRPTTYVYSWAVALGPSKTRARMLDRPRGDACAQSHASAPAAAAAIAAAAAAATASLLDVLGVEGEDGVDVSRRA